MSFLKFFPITIFIAFQAFVMMVIEPKIAICSVPFISWIAFQAWAMYFLAGCNIPMGIKTLVGYLGGIVASVAIIELMGHMYGPLAVFIVVIFVIASEKVPGINFIPSWFVGAGVFFAMFGLNPLKLAEGTSKIDVYLLNASALLYSCLVGLVFGFVTVKVRTWYESKVMPSDTPDTA